MTSQQFLVCDNSTLANFKAWAQAISNFFSTAGWTKSTDTGQVNWSTIASVPGSNAYVYEVWEPNDGLTNFYVKVAYGNQGSSNCPSVQLTISTGTDGAGNPTGYHIGPINTNTNNFTAPSVTTQYECDFSGAAGRMCIMLWRNGVNNCQQAFCIERSLNSSGTYTSAYVTLWTIGWCGNRNTSQQSLVFNTGPAPLLANQNGPNENSPVRYGITNGTNFNNSIAIDFCAPLIGLWDYSCTVFGVGNVSEYTEGVQFNATLYGTAHTFMPSKAGPFQGCIAGADVGPVCFCMRYD